MRLAFKEFEATDFPDLLFWHEFCDESTVLIDSFGVYQVNDKGPNGFDVAISTDAYKPQYVNDINGFKVITGDGVDDRLVYDEDPTISRTHMSFFIVCQYISGSGYDSFFSNSSSGGSDNSFQLDIVNIRPRWNRDDINNMNLADDDIAERFDPVVYELHYDHDRELSETYRNGVLYQSYSGSWGSSGAKWSWFKYLCNRGTNAFLNCHIGECFAYAGNNAHHGYGNSVMHGPRERIALSLMNKWGIS